MTAADLARAEQQRLAALVRLQTGPALPERVCGVDVSYAVDSDRAIAVAAMIDTETFDVVETASAQGTAGFPYRPGLLSFRELPLILDALGRLEERPGLIVADGHGIAHPERFGLASHLGVISGIPTIGCAKTMFVGEHGPLGAERGASADIVDRQEVVGCAVRTQTNVKPVFVSPGHLTDVRSAVDLVLALAPRYRLPETTRAADALSRRLIWSSSR